MGSLERLSIELDELERLCIELDKKQTDLVELWANCVDLEQREYLFQAAKSVEVELRKKARLLSRLREDQKRMDREAQHMPVMLQCTPACWMRSSVATGVVVMYKDYEPGKVLCDKCGRALKTKEDHNLDRQFKWSR